MDYSNQPIWFLPNLKHKFICLLKPSIEINKNDTSFKNKQFDFITVLLY